MFQGTLLAVVLKGANSVLVEPLGAADNFDTAGGVAYIGRDRFTYTGLTLGTTSFTLDGCEGISFSHLLGEDISPHYGMRLIDIIPQALKGTRNDPDGLGEAIFQILEDSMYARLKDVAIDVHRNIDPNRADAIFLPYLCSNLGLEYNENMPEDTQRSLARQAAALLSMRGTENAFKFLVWHVLGYDLDVEIFRAKLLARMNDSNFRMLQEPAMFPIEAETVSYWQFTEGAGVNASSITGGNDFVLSDVAQWDTVSMFRKDLSILIDAVHPSMATVSSNLDVNSLHGKRQFALEWFMRPSPSMAFPQVVLSKGTLISVVRPNATDLTITFDNGVDSATLTVTDCLVDSRFNYVALLYDRPTLTVLVDGEVVGASVGFDFPMRDIGSSWVFGDATGVAPFLGNIDTFRITVGKRKYPAECYGYFEHINLLRSHLTDVDRNAYMLEDSNDGFVRVTILNGEGEYTKVNFLRYIIEEWLTLSNYEVIDVAHLPLELSIGFL